MIASIMLICYFVIYICIPFIIFNIINVKQYDRDKQFLFPIFALIYSILYMIFINRYQSSVVGFARGLLQIYSLLCKLFSISDDLINNITDVQLYNFMLNVVMLWGFVFIKTVIIKLIVPLCKNKGFLYKNIAQHFYYKEDNKSILKDKWIIFRQFIKNISLAATVMLVFYLIATTVTKNPNKFLQIYYISFALIVLSEIYNFLNGLSKSEYKKQYGEIGGSEKTVEFSKLRKVYRNLFGDRIVYDYTFANTKSSNSSPTSIVDSCLKSDLLNEKILGEVLLKHLSYTNEIDNNLVLASRKLLRGDNVLFVNPFYKDIAPYAFLPINQCLLNNKKVLIIVGNKDDNVIKFIKDELDNVMGVQSYWQVEYLNTDNENIDVGVLDASNIYNLDIFYNNINFLEKVDFVLMLEPSKMLTTNQIALGLYVDRCNKYGNTTYACVDRSIDGLVDSLSHVIKQSIVEVSALNRKNNVSSVVIFDADGQYLNNRIFSEVSRYLGVGIELATTAIKNQIEQVTWYSINKFPIKDIGWITSQYYQVLCDYMGLDNSQINLEDVIKFKTEIWSQGAETDKFIITEDEFNNLFEMYRYFNSRITGECFINVISGNYLLKEYMKSASSIFLNDFKAIPAMAADYVRNERNLIIKLLMLMSENDLSEDYIKDEMEFSSIHYENVSETLEKLIDKHILGYEKKDILTVEFKMDYSKKIFGETKAFYSVGNEDLADENLVQLSKSYYILEDQQKNANYLGYELVGHVYQKHLPTQHLVYEGKYYEIMSITDEKGVLVKRASEHIDGRFYYSQIRYYEIKNSDSEVISENTVDGIVVSKILSTINVHTIGYFKMLEKGNLATAKRVELSNIPDRQYVNKEVLKVTIPNASIEVTKTITVLLNELFYTIFPNDYHYMCAVCGEEDKSFDEYGYRSNIMENGIYFIEDSQMDLGLLYTVERNFERFMEIITDYLLWNIDEYGDREDETNILPSQISQNNIRYNKNYLLFGFDKLPGFFNIDKTVEIMKKYNFHNSYISQARNSIKPFHKLSKEYKVNLLGEKCCDFCGVILTGTSYAKLDDGRIRCNKCSKTVIKSISEFSQLLKVTKGNIENFFQIELNASIDVKITDALELARKLGRNFKATDGFDPRALGFVRNRSEKFTIVVENGAPKLSTIATFVHEYIHIWQYVNWNNNIGKKTSQNDTYEGMAMWAEIQYLIYIGEIEYAKRLEVATLKRKDVYGRGLKMYLAKYPFSSYRGMNLKNPFKNSKL